MSMTTFLQHLQALIEIDPRSREWLPPLPRMRYYDN
jgi:hypothetical protein